MYIYVYIYIYLIWVSKKFEPRLFRWFATSKWVDLGGKVDMDTFGFPG